MLFGDFHIIAIAQNRCRLAQQIHHQVDADGHVARTEYRDFSGCRAHFRQLFLAVSGGADDQRRAGLFAVIQQHFQRVGIGKVNDNITCAGKLMGIRINRIICQLFGIAVKAGNNLHIFLLGDNVRDDLAHTAIAAAKSDFQHPEPLLTLLPDNRHLPLPASAVLHAPLSYHTAACAAHQHPSPGSALPS